MSGFQFSTRGGSKPFNARTTSGAAMTTNSYSYKAKAEKAVVAKAIRFVLTWEKHWVSLDKEYSALAVACKRLLKARKRG